MAAFDDTVAGQLGERVAGGHEADAVNPRELALGRDDVAGFQLAGIDAAADGVLNLSIGRFVAAICHRCGVSIAVESLGRVGVCGQVFPEHHIRTGQTGMNCYRGRARESLLCYRADNTTMGPICKPPEFTERGAEVEALRRRCPTLAFIGSIKEGECEEKYQPLRGPGPVSGFPQRPASRLLDIQAL